MSDKHWHITQGRMNPPHAGHEMVVNSVMQGAEKDSAGHTIILTGSHDPKKNPLKPEQKLMHARRAFPGANITVSDNETPTLLHHASKLYNQGVTHLTLHVGSDRAPEFHALLNKYNGVEGRHGKFDFKKINIKEVGGERKEGSSGIEGASASKMRAHATAKKQKDFHSMAPSAMSKKHREELYRDVRKGMELEESFSMKKFLEV